MTVDWNPNPGIVQTGTKHEAKKGRSRFELQNQEQSPSKPRDAASPKQSPPKRRAAVSVANNNQKTDVTWQWQLVIFFGSLIALFLCRTVFVKTENPAKKPLLKAGNQGLV